MYRHLYCCIPYSFMHSALPRNYVISFRFVLFPKLYPLYTSFSRTPSLILIPPFHLSSTVPLPSNPPVPLPPFRAFPPPPYPPLDSSLSLLPPPSLPLSLSLSLSLSPIFRLLSYFPHSFTHYFPHSSTHSFSLFWPTLSRSSPTVQYSMTLSLSQFPIFLLFQPSPKHILCLNNIILCYTNSYVWLYVCMYVFYVNGYVCICLCE